MALSVAVFGQAAFGRDVLLRLLAAGHEVVGVVAPPVSPAAAAAGREDALAEEAQRLGLRLLRPRALRRGGAAIAERVKEHAALGAELNVLAFVTQILPMEILDAPRFGSLCFHPSLLPKFRGGNALAWQIIMGERESGVTIFRPDAGVDTGPIVLQQGGFAIEKHHTAASLYFEQLYEPGVAAMLRAVELVEQGEARPQPQNECLASHQGLVDDEVARIDWQRPAAQLDCLLRGCDPNPGAHTRLDGETLRLFGCRLEEPGEPDEVEEPDAASAASAAPGTVLSCAQSLRIAARGGVLRVARLRRAGGPKLPAADSGIAPGAKFG